MTDAHDERTVIEWLRRIQLDWSLAPQQIAAILRVDPIWLRKELESASEPSGATVPPGLESAPPLIAVYRKLSRKFENPEEQVKWLFTKHPDFGDQKPIDVAASSLENLFWLGYYLDTAAL